MYFNGISLKVKQCKESSQEAGQQLSQVIERAKALLTVVTSYVFVYISMMWCGNGVLFFSFIFSIYVTKQPSR